MSAPARFRKKPVEVEAIEFNRDAFRAAIRFVPIEQFSAAGEENGRLFMDIRTLEGVMRADEGDWIIRGVAGEHYACKPAIFELTYDRVAS